MKASIVDLRYNMKSVLKALDRNEEVIISYHGKDMGIIKPISSKVNLDVKDHPLFGMLRADKRSVNKIITTLRTTRYGDV